MSQPETEFLSQIPSPARRLWAGLWIVLSIFIVFGVYTVHEIRWLEDFQVNVVQKNRKASLQLLRLQNDAYALAISLREMTEASARYRLADWRAQFVRLRNDMSSAVALENRYAVRTTAADEKRGQLRHTLEDFWRSADQVFALAASGREATAKLLIRSELERKRAVISEIVARLLVLNDEAQVEAAGRINSVYGKVKTDILVATVILFLLALGTGLYTLQANRKTFERLHHLAARLQAQSEQLRRLSWKLIDVQEETIRQVARDLHDEFGQILTAIGATLSRAGRKAAKLDPPLLEELGAVKQIVEQTLQKIRDRSQMFRPAILDDFGLEQALQWFVAQFSRQAGVDVHFDGTIRDGLFPQGDAIHVYRIVQEALNNVARHARARQAWVTAREQQATLWVEIRDDGLGFETDGELSGAPGVGLMGMRERAEHLGGSLDIRSARGKGTVVRLSIPLKRAGLTHQTVMAG